MPAHSGRTNRSFAAALVLALLLALTPPLSAPAAAATQQHTVTYDKYSVKLDGEPVYLWSAEFHYFRLPSPDAWRDVLQKIKAAGFNAVSLYFAWSYHSPAPGKYDFTGIRDVERLLTMAEETGLYVIARPGPYINAEISGGGFPAWRKTRPGVNRTSEHGYMTDAREWMRQINPIIARHLYTRGTGNVILYQIENEYQGGRQDADYMDALETWARDDGIDVPTFINDGGANGNWTSGKGAADMYGFDAYPQGFDCADPQNWRDLPDYSWVRKWVPNTPMIMPEAQGGAFDGWGGRGYDNCRTMTGPDFTRVFTSMSLAAGVTFKNFYMTYGGTNWGWLSDPNAGYTSYDYGAPIDEARQLTTKYDEFKRLGHFLAAVKPIARTDPATAPTPTDPALRIDRRVNPDDGTQFLFVRHGDTRVTETHRTTFALAGRDGEYPRVPQQGDVTVAGRDAKMLVAGYDLGGQRLVYSTSQIMTHARIGERDTALLYGRDGQGGETVLRYASQPQVRVLAGSVESTWDAARGDLRLNYTHRGLARVLVEGGGRPALELLIGNDDEAGAWWQRDTAAGPVLVRGPYLVRSAEARDGVLALTGDTKVESALEVIAPPSLRRVTWNGQSSQGQLAGPVGVRLPALTNWRTQAEAPESQPGFNDASWTVADHLTAVHPTLAGTYPVLAADEYGYHHGDIWYRGRFRATGAETALALTAMAGNKGVYAAWLNGRYLGSGSARTTQLAIPSGLVRPGAENVLSVLVENMGHNEEWGHDFSKEPRGLISASLPGGPTTITWKLQGSTGWDTVRGPFNSGGLYGERAGWSLPGYPDRGWSTTQLPDDDRSPGLRWYRTTFDLDLPRGQDTAVALRVADSADRHYRAQLYVNGWLIGRYINDVGPQREFVIPPGILKARGQNTVAVATWSTDNSGFGAMRLVAKGSAAGGIPIGDVPAPGWDRGTHTIPAATAALTVEAEPFLPAGEESEVTTTFTAIRAATDVTLALEAPAGWTVRATTPATHARVPAGETVTTRWTVVAKAGGDPYVLLSGTARFRQGGAPVTLAERRGVQVPPPGPVGDQHVSDLPLVRSANGWGPVEVDLSNGENAAGDGRPLSLGGVTYEKGLGVHAPSSVRLWLGGRCTSFDAVLGVDDEVGDGGSVVFTVTGDDRQLAKTGTLTGPMAGEPVKVDVTGVRWLDLDVTDSGDHNWSDHADWADARVACAP